MKKKLFTTLVCLVAGLLVSNLAFSQIQMPRPSPEASVSQVVGFTKISIDYCSPAVKGRKMFGDILPYGTPWRAGANGPTVISFSTPVTIGEKTLPAGKYSIFITPAESGDWTVHFNNKANAIYAYMADGQINEENMKKDEAVAIKVKPETASAHERLVYTISAQDNSKARVSMLWDKIKISFEVDTQAKKMMESFTQSF